MPSLPPLDITTNTNHAPHVVVLGAGARLAAFPNGDRCGMVLPLMRNLVEVIGLAPLLHKHAIATSIADFEAFYDDLATTKGANPALLRETEETIHSYFAKLELPDEPTLYDYLLLSLREKDLIATFNWDPFLAQAYRRNADVRRLPQIAFLHGNVAFGACQDHKKKGFIFQTCSDCGKRLTPSRLLYPVKQKNYTDALIKDQWDTLRSALMRAYMVTIFGYSAPVTDVVARKLMLEEWRGNPSVELAQIDIVDIRPRKKLEVAWKDFFIRQNYGIYKNVLSTRIFRHPRRSCDALAMATLQGHPWPENPFPRSRDLGRLQEWIRPLLDEEEQGMLTGKPCPSFGATKR